jgi:hypothetical protein
MYNLIMIMPISQLDSNKEHFRAALNRYESILTILDQFELELPYDDNEPFPGNWQEDPLSLFGQYHGILELNQTEAEEFRLTASEFVECNGAQLGQPDEAGSGDRIYPTGSGLTKNKESGSLL